MRTLEKNELLEISGGVGFLIVAPVITASLATYLYYQGYFQETIQDSIQNEVITPIATATNAVITPTVTVNTPNTISGPGSTLVQPGPKPALSRIKF